MVDVAVLVDGCQPIGARVRRIGEPELRLVSLGGTSQGEALVELVCRELEHLQDYCQPHAPGEVMPTTPPGLYPRVPLVSLSLFGDSGVREQALALLSPSVSRSLAQSCLHLHPGRAVPLAETPAGPADGELWGRV